MKVLLVFLFAYAAAGSEKARYDNYRVYQISIENSQQLELMQEIENYPDGYRFMSTLQNRIGSRAEILVPPHKFGEIGELIEKFHLQSKLLVTNWQEVIDNEEKPSKHRKDFDFHLDWTVYWTLEEIYDWMDALQLEFPDIVTNFTVGTSSEGRQIRGIIINTLPPLPGKRSIFFESTIHSNEWISAATTTWIINEFLRSTDSDVREIANRYTLYFVPVVNVDGYKYSWTTDRNWRKTRGATRNILCKGTDPNRNWDLNFSEHGSSNNPCSNNYAGDFAFSEPETKALSEFIQGIYQLIGYFSFHSYSQYLMIPYAYTTEKVENYSDLYEIGKMAIESLNSKHETQYNVGSIESFFGLVSGSSVDWVKKNKDPNIVYCYELRPTQESDYGMLLPADQIIDNSEEIFSSLITIFKESYNKGLL